MSGQRFARQYGDEPPPGFPLASPCTGIVRGLSGLSGHALSPIWSTHLRMVMREYNLPLTVVILITTFAFPLRLSLPLKRLHAR